MMKKSVFVMLAAAAMVSCTESNLNDAPAIDNGEIKVKSVAYDVNASTRAPYEGNDLEKNPLTARVVTSITEAFTASYADGTMVFNSTDAAQYSSLNSGTTSKYPTEGDGDLYLFGLHPADFSKWSVSATSSTFTFTGKEDVMGAAIVKSTGQTDVKMLTFKHLLTRLDVKLKADAGAVTTFGDIRNITLSDAAEATTVCNTIVFKATDGDSENGSDKGAVSFWSMSADASNNKTYTDKAIVAGALPTVETYCAYAMVAPVKDVAMDNVLYYLAIETEKKGVQPVDVKLEKALLGSSAGYAYEVTVNFKSNGQIEASASVIPWKEGGNASGEITD